MAKPSTRPSATAKATQPPAPSPPATTQMVIDLTPSPEAQQGLTLRQQATALVVRDKDTHRGALEFIRGAKQLKRTIEEHWSRITRVIDNTKRDLLDLKRRDVEPVEEALRIAEGVTVAYQQAEDRRVREEQDRLRRQEEERARQQRERELAEQEARAEALERDSPDLSNREQIFVEAYVDGLTDRDAAVRAAFKNPKAAALRLLATQKIVDAISAKREAIAIREQAAAKKASPLDVNHVATVQRETSHVAGTRTTMTYGCEEVYDKAALYRAIVAGDVSWDAVQPNPVYLNDQARKLKDLFEASYPGCRLRKKAGIAG